MATQVWQANLGDQLEPSASATGVTTGVGNATIAKSVELTVDLAASMSREQVLLALENIRNYIMQHQWPPA